MTYIVDQMFPTKKDGGALLDDFSQFIYWRVPIPDPPPLLLEELVL